MNDLSYQLYSSRRFPPLDKTLKMLTDIGYTTVEGYGGLFHDVEATRSALEVAGLAMTSAHISLQALTDDQAGSVRIARALGISSIYAPILAEEARPADARGYGDFAGQLEELARIYQAEGICFGWHNHAFEFEPLADGSVPIAIILNEAPTLEWQADIAWIVRGGGDPVSWIMDFGQRITAVHVKDIAPEGENVDEDGWADVGHGTMDWATIIDALEKAPVRHVVVEHDNPADDARFARRSLNAVRKLMGGDR